MVSPRRAVAIHAARLVLFAAPCLSLFGRPVPAANPAAGMEELGAPPAGVYALDLARGVLATPPRSSSRRSS